MNLLCNTDVGDCLTHTVMPTAETRRTAGDRDSRRIWRAAVSAVDYPAPAKLARCAGGGSMNNKKSGNRIDKYVGAKVRIRRLMRIVAKRASRQPRSNFPAAAKIRKVL